MRSELTPTQMSEHLAKRKELWTAREILRGIRAKLLVGQKVLRLKRRRLLGSTSEGFKRLFPAPRASHRKPEYAERLKSKVGPIVPPRHNYGISLHLAAEASNMPVRHIWRYQRGVPTSDAFAALWGVHSVAAGAVSVSAAGAVSSVAPSSPDPIMMKTKTTTRIAIAIIT